MNKVDLTPALSQLRVIPNIEILDVAQEPASSEYWIDLLIDNDEGQGLCAVKFLHLLADRVNSLEGGKEESHLCVTTSITECDCCGEPAATWTLHARELWPKALGEMIDIVAEKVLEPLEPTP